MASPCTVAGSLVAVIRCVLIVKRWRWKRWCSWRSGGINLPRDTGRTALSRLAQLTDFSRSPAVTALVTAMRNQPPTGTVLCRGCLISYDNSSICITTLEQQQNRMYSTTDGVGSSRKQCENARQSESDAQAFNVVTSCCAHQQNRFVPGPTVVQNTAPVNGLTSLLCHILNTNILYQRLVHQFHIIHNNKRLQCAIACFWFDLFLEHSTCVPVILLRLTDTPWYEANQPKKCSFIQTLCQGDDVLWDKMQWPRVHHYKISTSPFYFQ